jgi:hypothetical protein
MDKNKTNKTKKRQGAGRPKIYLDLEILKNLASIGCPDYEIAGVMGVSARTLKRCGIRQLKKIILICKFGFQKIT